MNEGHTIEQQPDKEAELTTFFESQGYENIQLIPHRGRNDILQATKNEQKCFIKKFNASTGSDDNVSDKVKNEGLCYENLPPDMVAGVVEINIEAGYIALEHIDFDEITEDAQHIQELADFETQKLPNIDASFLPEISWKNYERVFEKLRQLESEGVIDNVDAIIQIFKNKKDTIMSAEKIFSLQDFNRSNLKKVDGQLQMFDFEDPKQDNAMYDMATMSIDIRGNEELSNAYQEKIQASGLYNEDLFNMMTVRRAVIVMYARMEEIKSGEISEFPQNNINAFHEAIDKLAA